VNCWESYHAKGAVASSPTQGKKQKDLEDVAKLKEMEKNESQQSRKSFGGYWYMKSRKKSGSTKLCTATHCPREGK